LFDNLVEVLFNGRVTEKSVLFTNCLLLWYQAEIQLNLQKRRGHGVLSVLRPKFSGVLGEALDVAARWSGDVVSALNHLHICLYMNFCYMLVYLLLSG